MMARIVTKIGDVFEVKLDGIGKKYFQLVAFDLTQLNSDVIRAFKEVYADDAAPEMAEIIQGEVDFYAHCVTKFGVKMGLWQKVGSSNDVGKSDDVIFRDTRDYGSKIGGRKVKTSNLWYMWNINKDRILLGAPSPRYRNSYIGLVFPPAGIMELLKGNKCPINYPDFDCE